jgi:hypothetical protein
MTGSAGIVVEVVLDSTVVEVDGPEVELLVVVSITAVVEDTPAAVVAVVESLLLLHAARASAAIMNVEVDLVYFTVLSAVQSALRAWGVPKHV